MPREKRSMHPRFMEYMQKIAAHPNYRGLPISKRADGSLVWVTTAKAATGKARQEWCIKKAQEMGLEIQPGTPADVMLAIHPTKSKACQICGREMSLYYHYPNFWFLSGLNRKFGTEYTACDHIADIWSSLENGGIATERVAEYLIQKGGLKLDCRSATRQEVIAALEYACRKGDKKCLGPGAMSNFPDRFDGFHSYNRCCRAAQDKGRSRENLKTYGKDRRAYEYWSDGNIHAANQFMTSKFFDGTTADHVGPIALGFVHDPRYLRPMGGGDNSAKRDRLLVADVEKIAEIQRRTGVYPMSWYSRRIWEYILGNYTAHPNMVPGAYRAALKQNMANFMFILWHILKSCPESGEAFLIGAFLQHKFELFDYSYDFNNLGEITARRQRHKTASNQGETKRYCRVALGAVHDYMQKGNRNIEADLSKSELEFLKEICCNINSGAGVEEAKPMVEALAGMVQERLIAGLRR